jgi:Domain of unknown function (DUF4440)
MLDLLVLVAAVAAVPSLPIVTVPAQPALTAQIARADAQLFDMFFVAKCDAPRFRAMLADDLEFYHDKDGFFSKSGDEFLAAYQKNCHGREDSTAWRSRRQLVAGTLRVDPVPGHGAMEVADHVFYERHGVDGKERLAGKAKIAMVWVLGNDGKWRVSRILSYAHQKAD